jgi:serine protease Do
MMKKFVKLFVLVFCFLNLCSLNQRSSVFAQTADFSTAVENVAKIVGPSVVAIKTQVTEHYQARRYYGGSPHEDELFNQFFEDFFGAPPSYEFKRAGLGSGVIIDKRGYILTNEHVVANAQDIIVTLPDGREFTAKMEGIDSNSDLAVIKIQESAELPVAKLGDSENLKIGQWVVALGNPFGHILSDSAPTLTAGVISALHRALPQTSRRDIDYSDLIQTDAAINPGNSGGPLVNLNGEVVGINVAIFSTTGGYQGIGFAIPINYAKNFVNQIIKGEPVIYGWMGISIQDINQRLARYFGLPANEGALVIKVMPESPAEKAGLKEGDIILAINNIKIRNSTTLLKYIGQAPIGKEAELSLWRENNKLTVPVAIEKRPDLAMPPAGGEPKGQAAKSKTLAPVNEWRGIKVSSVSDNAARTLNLENRRGALITDVARNSPAAQAGLRPGDIIISVNRRPVEKVEDFYDAVTGVKGSCLIRTMRGYFVVEE